MTQNTVLGISDPTNWETVTLEIIIIKCLMKYLQITKIKRLIR